MKQLIVLMLMLTGICFAQESGAKSLKDATPEVKAETNAKEPAIYKFKFAVYELQNGKRLNERDYLMILKEGIHGVIKVGNRVPIATGKDGSQFQYFDVGLEIACRFLESNGATILDIKFEQASIVSPEQVTGMTVNQPVIRQLRQDASGMVTAGSPVIIASLDDSNTSRTMQLEVTATKMK